MNSGYSAQDWDSTASLGAIGGGVAQQAPGQPMRHSSASVNLRPGTSSSYAPPYSLSRLNLTSNPPAAPPPSSVSGPQLKQSHASVVMNGNGTNNNGLINRRLTTRGGAECSLLAQSHPFFQGPAHSQRVAKPLPQDAVAPPTVVSVRSCASSLTPPPSSVPSSASCSQQPPRGKRLLPTSMMKAHFEHDQSPRSLKLQVNQSEKNYRLESRALDGQVISVQVKGQQPATGVQRSRVLIDGGDPNQFSGPIRVVAGPAGARRLDIDNLCQRAETNRMLSSQRSSIASTSDSVGNPADLASGDGSRHFDDILTDRHRQSPIQSSLSASTESSAESYEQSPVVRVESPLPPSVYNSKNLGQCIQKCAPKAFRFFMEQHIENIIKQHRERQSRQNQVCCQ